MSGTNSQVEPHTRLPPKSGTRKSPPKLALAKNGSNKNGIQGEEELQRLPPKSGTRKSPQKPAPRPAWTLRPNPAPRPAWTLKKKPRHPAINITKQQFERFRQQFEDLFAYMDREQEYEVSDEMIEPYITNHRNNLSSPPEIYSTAQKLFKSHRYLLYLDQFIAFVNEFAREPKFPTSFTSFTSNNYFDLPIASRVIPKLAMASNNHGHGNLAQEYSAEVYRELQPINDKVQRTSRNVRDISLICCHGGLDTDEISFLVVPDDVIIAFPTPLNKSQSSSFTNQIFFDILEPYRTNPGFLANPACYFRSDNCLMHTIYYYPGQLIPNFKFSYKTSIDWENAEMGFYPNNPHENMRDELFSKGIGTKYSTDIAELFKDKLEFLKNKITFINCCRSCDSDISNIETEFLYRYEHIITYMNISNCLAIESDINNGRCKDNTFRRSLKPHKIAENFSGHSYFYDPTLLSTFKDIKPKKHEYLSKDDTKWNRTIDKLNKLTSINQEKYFSIILQNLLRHIKDNPKLFSDRILDLFSKTSMVFSLQYYLKNSSILSIIYNRFEKYNLLEKFNTIFYNIISILYGLNSVSSEFLIDLYKFVESVYDDKDGYVINLFIKVLKDNIKNDNNTIFRLACINIIYKDFYELLFTKINDNDIATEITIMDKYDVRNIITRKIQILCHFNKDPIIGKIFKKDTSTSSDNFINLIFWCYSKLIIKDGNQLICLYDIYTKKEDGKLIYMFPPDSGIDIDMPEESIKDTYLAKIAQQEQSPLLYSICFNAKEKDVLFSPELSTKLFETALKQYQNNDLLAGKFTKFKNTYLHIFIYMILYVDFPSLVRQVIEDCIKKLIEITNLHDGGFTNLFLYLVRLIAKYTTFSPSKIPISEDINFIVLRPHLTDKRQMLPEDSEICKLFITKFETDYKSAHLNRDDLPEIRKLEAIDGVFETLFYTS